jgi:uncharacterized membrane protein HdeD (DUF308 family)
MKTARIKMKTEPKRFDYGVGALAVLVISIGAVGIIYGLNLLTLDIYNLLVWILGPLGVYTAVYSLVAKGESTYYLVWGVVMVAVAMVFAFYPIVSPILVLGVLAIVLAVAGIIAYARSRR